MSPEPLIHLQRRLSLVGAIRAGGEKPARGVGRKLEHWRITSPRQQLIEQAASLYGGDVSPWQSPVGQEYQTYTSVDELPVLVMPAYSLRQTYELWEGATKRTRLCDGVDEELSGGPCICNATGEDKCDVYTRLVVALPELDTVLGWRLITRGVNAAHELPAMIGLIQHAGGTRTFVPARLRLEQRRGVIDGQVTRFVVPTIDLGVGYLALAAPASASPQALLPGEPEDARNRRRAATSEQAPSADGPTSPPRAVALGADHDDDVDAAAAVPHPSNEAPPAEPEEQQTKAATKAQKTKLDVLVGTLRDAGHITTDGLYEAIASLRGTGGLDLAMTTPDYVAADGVTHKAIDEDGVTHWAPLREKLRRQEAHQLIEWLTEKERRVSAGDAARAEPAAAASTPAPATPSEPLATPSIPYNEFPDGY